MIVLLQLLNISLGNLSFMVSLRGGWSCFSFLSVCEQHHRSGLSLKEEKILPCIEEQRGNKGKV